jgi:hypothetical protein
MEVRRAFDDAQKGQAILRFHLNKGPSDINLDEPVRRHFSRAFSQDHELDYRLIDLVLQATDLPRLTISPQEQAEHMREFRLILLLYLMDRYGQDFAFQGQDLDTTGVEAVAIERNQGLLDLSAGSTRWYNPRPPGNKLCAAWCGNGQPHPKLRPLR